MKLKLLLTIILISFLSCKTTEEPILILPDPPDKPEIIVVEDINTASQQINILIIQEFKWRLYDLDVKWVLGLISDKEREIEKDRILQILSKLTKKD